MTFVCKSLITCLILLYLWMSKHAGSHNWDQNIIKMYCWIVTTQNTCIDYNWVQFALINHRLKSLFSFTGFANSNTFSTVATNSWTPVNNWNTHPAAKGFHSTSGWNGYSSYPINTQYWTGHQYIPHQQYPYNQYAYNNWLHPAHNGYYPQQYGFVHQQNGYYPNFNAGYWVGNGGYHPASMNTVYMPHPAAYMPHPVYHAPQPLYYHTVFYNGRWVHQPVYAHPRHFDRGFLGGTGGELAKGLLGALLVGTIAGKVARGWSLFQDPDMTKVGWMTSCFMQCIILSVGLQNPFLKYSCVPILLF